MATSFEIRSQMRAKVALYLDQGARKVWMVFETGTVRFFGPEGEHPRSVFPTDPHPEPNR
jgi:hypothetical protein